MKPIINDPQKYSVAIYVRLSKEDSDKEKGDDVSESIKNQTALLLKYVSEHRLSLYRIYTDDGYSGTNTDRPAFQEMIQDIEDCKVNMVITKDFSRLGRDRIAFGYYTEKYFPEHDVRYIAVADDYDNIDGCNNQAAAFKSLMNEMLAADTSRKVAYVKHLKQQEGKFIGGKAPYGYVKSPEDKNKLIVDECAAENVRYIFELAAKGMSCRQIAIRLSDEKIPTPAQYAKLKRKKKGPYSGKWSSERISEMLKNQVYIGNMEQGRVRKVSYKSKKCKKLPREEWVVVENTHEPIIDKETFKKVGELIKSRNNTRSCKHDFLLKGLIFCHECGYPLGVIQRPLAKGRKELYFVCRTYQRFTKYHKCTCHCAKVSDVTEAVIEQVKSVCNQYAKEFDLNELVQESNKFLQDERRKQGKDLVALKSKLELTEHKIDKSYDDKLSGLIDDEMFQRIYNGFKTEQQALQNKIIEIENSNEEDILFDIKNVSNIVTEFLNAKEYSRDLLVSLIDRIELSENKEIKIFFKFRQMEIANRL